MAKLHVKMIFFFITKQKRIKRVELLIEPGQSLGLMIRGGVEYGLGIFITGVDKDSVADRAGLMVCWKFKRKTICVPTQNASYICISDW